MTGSVSEALIGVRVKPGDIDIIAHTDDFFKMREVFPDYIVEPFFDNRGEWALRYFARLCIDGVRVEIAADLSRNEDNHLYHTINWRGHRIKVEPLHVRFEAERFRGRTDRIEAIKEYLEMD